MLSASDVKSRITEFLARRSLGGAGVERADPPAVTEEDFVVRGSLTIRYMSAAAWAKSSKQVHAYPGRFLYLSDQPEEERDPPPRFVSTLEQQMLELMQSAPSTGDMMFVVGRGRARIHAHRAIVEKAIPAKLVYAKCKEGTKCEVHLPETQVSVFRALLTYVYTRMVFDADMDTHAVGLMDEAAKYEMFPLVQKYQEFLCWKVQVRRAPV